jgi:2-keto-4-pentenoate hydratase/2-oxohepta-3-ene-1,7-dioic acid hydratase in catechol pathway
MKIARFESADSVQLGVVRGERIIPFGVLGANIADMIVLIEAGPNVLRQIGERLAETDEDAGQPLSSVRLLAPLRPRKFLGLGMNYQRHAEEARRLGIEIPEKQLWFNKQTSCVSGPYDAIDPGVTEKLDYEVELGVIIGKPAKSVKAKDAFGHIFGYLVVNDISARDWQFHTTTMTMGKSFDTHGPIGPWIVTADEIADPQALGLRSFVNGEKRQDSNTSDFIHGIAEQIEYLSTAFTLEPGDVLSTGTPEGVGVAMQPPQFLQPGDVVRCEIDGIGAIENKVAV